MKRNLNGNNASLPLGPVRAIPLPKTDGFDGYSSTPLISLSTNLTMAWPHM